MKRVLLSVILLVAAATMSLSAKTFFQDTKGFWYYINSDGKTVTLNRANDTSPSYDNLSGTVTIPAQVSYQGTLYPVTVIGNGAFQGCSGITRVNLPATLITIDDGAFWECSGLTSLTLPGSVTTIGENAFWKSGLTSITIPNSVTTIGGAAFYGCESLASVTLGSGVETIGEGAFQGCTALTGFTIPASVTDIGLGIFEGCTALAAISVDAGNSVFDSRNGCNAIIESQTATLLHGCKNTVIPYFTNAIADHAFRYCTGLKSVDIPNWVSSIGSAAFEGCTCLTRIVIPYSVTSIGSGAFKDCTSLSRIDAYVNPYKVDMEYSDVFYNVPVASCLLHVLSIFQSDFATADQWSQFSTVIPDLSQSAILRYYYFSGEDYTGAILTGEVEEPYYQPLSGSITIPKSVTIDGVSHNVTAIDAFTFMNCEAISGVTIPNTITTIGDQAFYDCNSLTSITIPSSVATIGYDAFYSCTGLSSVFIPKSVTVIEEGAFAYCSGLASIVVESGNPNYDSRNNCNAIIETATTTLLAGCRNTVIPSSITKIASAAFALQSKLTSVTIPNSVTTIGNYVFDGCTGLTSVNIPSSITYIGFKVFRNCGNLLRIDSYPDPEKVKLGSSLWFNEFEFEGIPVATCKLHVLPKYVEAYRNADQWKEFAHIIGDLVIKGDLNGDESIDGNDVSILLEMALSGGVSAAQLEAADLNNDQAVDGNDVSIILEKALSGD